MVLGDFEMWWFKRMLKIKWFDKISKNSIKREVCGRERERETGHERSDDKPHVEKRRVAEGYFGGCRRKGNGKIYIRIISPDKKEYEMWWEFKRNKIIVLRYGRIKWRRVVTSRTKGLITNIM